MKKSPIALSVAERTPPPGHWSEDTKIKPRFRGTSHQYGFFVVLGAGAVLVALAPTRLGMISAAAYAGSLVWVLGVSALYHRPMWSLPMRRIMRRVDHASIFVLAIGSYTPLCLMALPPREGALVLQWAIWGSIAGAIIAASWAHRPRMVSVGMYASVGWMAVVHIPELIAGLGHVGFGLILAGGISYGIGGLVYGLRWPNPRPATFGYHEVFHLFTVLGCSLHFIAVMRLVKNAA